MHVEAYVPAVNETGLATVNTHPHTQFMSVRPPMVCKRSLRLGGGSNRGVRGLEDDEESVTLDVDLVAVMRIERGAHNASMVR